MARTFINQSSQIGNSEIYDDQLPMSGIALEFTGSDKTIQDDLNALRTMMKNISGEDNWYDAPLMDMFEISGSLSAEISRAVSAEDVLTSGLSTEVSNARSAEASIVSSLSTEASTARAAEDVLTSGLSTEVSNARSAESSLATLVSTSVSSEASRAGSVETVLAGEIVAERGRIDAILSASSADADTFKEIVDLINSVDTTSDGAFASYVTGSNAALSTEVSNARSAETSIASSLSTEVSTARSAEVVLTSGLSTEVSTARSAETSIASSLSTEASTARAAEAALESAKVNRAGDTMTGPLNFSGAGESALIASASLYVSSSAAYTDLVPGFISLFESGIAAMPTNDSHVTTKAYVDQEAGLLYDAIDGLDARATKTYARVTAAVAANGQAYGAGNIGGGGAGVNLDADLPVGCGTGAGVDANDFKSKFDVFVNGQLMEAGAGNDVVQSALIGAAGNGAALLFDFPLVVGDKICVIAYT